MVSPLPQASAANEKQKAASASTGARPVPRGTYLSNGQMLASPPLTARINSVINAVYNAAGLYVTSFFSLDPYTAAMNSSFNTVGPGRHNNMASAGRSVGGGSGGSGGSGGNGGSRPDGRRFGTVDDVRGPECGSCQ